MKDQCELVLLPGWGFDASVWKFFIPYLQNHFHITALDLLTKQHKTSKFTLHTLTEHVLTHAPPSAIFLGWSLGGLVAMNIAIHHPMRISHLISIASTPKFIATEHWPGISSDVLDQFSKALKTDYQATLQQFITLQFQGSNTDRRLIKTLRQQMMEAPLPSQQALDDGLNILKATDLRQDLKKISCPQLYLLGRCDTLVPSTIAVQLQKLTQHATIDILPKVSHAPFLSNPSLCAEKIIKFI